MTTPALTTRIKSQLNGLLKPIGLQIGTTVAMKVEEERLRVLRENGHWQKSKYDQGLRLNPEKHLAFLRETCLPYQAQYRKFPQSPNGDSSAFYLDNGYFRSVDAELLYSVVRKQQPGQIIEVGSGHSTRLMNLAIRDGKLSTVITSIDPDPRVNVTGCVSRHIQSVVEHLEPGAIADVLTDGDILFIDSSHRIMTGGDVPYLFLEVLPRLKKGVWIHIHDIFFPLDYPLDCVGEGWGWGEQYLVHAFLSFNDVFEILWPGRFIWEFHRDEVIDVIPADPAVFPPSSLWLRKVL
jgi:predicted O-methyltransferase YrrM